MTPQIGTQSDGNQRKLSSFFTTNSGATESETKSVIDHEAEVNV